MKKRGFVIVLFLFTGILFSLSLTSGLLQNVIFNGDFQNGTTLYSNITHINNGTIWGSDVYPDRSTIISQKVCSNVTLTYKSPVCETNITNYTRVVIIRHRYNVTYENITTQRVIRFCREQTFTKNVSQCKYITSTIACFNPDGNYTNQLKLQNFEISFDNGSSWKSIPYYPNKISVNETDLLFRVNIPVTCSPAYYINRAIEILTPAIF